MSFGRSVVANIDEGNRFESVFGAFSFGLMPRFDSDANLRGKIMLQKNLS